MADTKVSALTAATPVGTDVVYLVDDPGGTPVSKKSTVAAVLASNGGFTNALADGTIKGDGVTDDSSAIETLLSAGGSVHFPAGTYLIGSQIDALLVDNLQVTCSPGAVFLGSSALNGNILEFDTNVSANATVDVVWVGGVFDLGTMPHSSVTEQETVGLRDVGTATGACGMEFRDGYFGKVVVDGATFTGRSGAYAVDEYKDPTLNHWMGDPTTATAGGGDSGVFANCGPGSVTVRNCIGIGLADALVYLTGWGNSGAAGAGVVDISHNQAYWCTTGVSVKTGQGTTGPKGTIIGNYLYGCHHGVDLIEHPNGTGVTDFMVAGNTVEMYQIAYRAQSCTRVTFDGNNASLGGYLDWFGEATHADGVVELTGGGAGSVNGITVNSVAIMSGAESFDTDLATTAAAVASNINAHTSTPNYVAYARGSEVLIQNATSGNDADGFAVVSSTTTITTTDTNMAYSFTSPRAYEIQGSVHTTVRNADVIDTAAEWETNRVAIQRPIAVRILSIDTASRASGGADIQTVDTTVDNLYCDGIYQLGGEITAASVTDPDRTFWGTTRTGDDLGDFSAPALLGASSAFSPAHKIVRVLASDDVRNNVDTRGSGEVPSGFSIPVHNGRRYRVRMWGVWDSASTNTPDARMEFFDVSGTEEGHWMLNAIGTGGSTSSAGQKVAKLWSQSYSFGVLSGTLLGVEAYGTMLVAGTGDFEFAWSQDTATAENTTLLAGATFEVEWIG